MMFFDTVISFLKDKEYRNLLKVTFMFILMGTVVYHYLEGWSWIDSAYFSIITLTTIGYGDFSPQTSAGKVFTIFYILIGIGVILGFINRVYMHYRKIRLDKKQQK